MGMSVLFTGDLSLSGVFRRRFESGASVFSPDLIDVIRSCDHTVCNLEGPATTRPHDIRPDVDTVTPPDGIPYLKDAGLDIFNLANNHMFDCDVDGFVDTVSAIEQAGGRCFGAGLDLDRASRILYLKRDDVTVALIGTCFYENRLIARKHQPGIFWEGNRRVLERRIRQARQNADWVVVNSHGREEYTRVPLPYRRRQIHRYLEQGADLVIAHHSHVAQGMEKIGRKMAFYSLGNFAFDGPGQDTLPYTGVAFLPKILFDKTTFGVELIPTTMDRNRGVVDIGDSAFLTEVERLSDFEHMQRKWRDEAYRIVVTERRKGTSASPEATGVAVRKTPVDKLKRFLYLAGKIGQAVRCRYRRNLYGGALLAMVIDRKRNPS